MPLYYLVLTPDIVLCEAALEKTNDANSSVEMVHSEVQGGNFLEDTHTTYYRSVNIMWVSVQMPEVPGDDTMRGWS